jgi:hypothetical protein
MNAENEDKKVCEGLNTIEENTGPEQDRHKNLTQAK